MLNSSMRHNWPPKPPKRPKLPWLSGVVVALAVISIWYFLNQQEDAQIKRATVSALSFTERLVRKDLDDRMDSLKRLAQRWELAGGTPKETWYADAVNYLSQQPGYQAIEWADASLYVRWIVPLKGNEEAQGFQISSTAETSRAAQRALVSRKGVLTAPINLVQGGLGFAAYFPLFIGERFDGLMVGVLSIPSWLGTIFSTGDNSAYQLAITVNGKEIYARNPQESGVAESWVEQSEFDLYGSTWVIRASPTASYLAAVHSRLSTVVLFFGMMMSVLLGWIVHAYILGKDQARRLRFSSSYLATLLKNLPGMAYRCGNQKNWPMDFVSEGCLALCGYSKSELEEHQVYWGDLIHPDDRQKLWQRVQEAISSGQSYEYECRILKRDGSHRWVWGRGHQIDSPDGTNIYLEGFITDITDRKQAETDLISAETYATAVVETAAEAVITIDASGHIEKFNGAAQHMFGYSTLEIVGKNVRTLMPEPHRGNHDGYIARYLSTNEARIIGRGREVSGQRKDGSVFPIHLSISEVISGSERKFVGLIRDLSEQRFAEQEAREHRDHLAHVDRLNMLGEMATGIAHEINQPLTAISMYAQSCVRFLESENPKTDRLKEALEKLSTQTHRAGAIIERMQQMARQRDSQREPIDGNELIIGVLPLAETEAHMRDITIELDVCEKSRVIRVDPVQIQQVVLNLLRNGMEAMEDNNFRDGRCIRLCTQCRQEGFTVSVIDSGTGVSAEVEAQLFQPFSSTKKTGMGLGLSICKSIVSAHGGQSKFHNNPQAGSTFYFTLPYETQEATTA